MQVTIKKETLLNENGDKKPHRLEKNFFSAILTLLSGGIIAQIIPYLATIILARLFEPDAFASFALFSSISGAAAIAATGRYELAILLPKEKRDADSLVLIAVIISFFMSCVFALFIPYLWRFFVSSNTTYWYFVPLATFFIASYQTFMSWFLRYGYYKQITLVRFMQTGVTALISIVLGWYTFHAGLIVGYLCGWIFATILFVFFMLFTSKFDLIPAIRCMKKNANLYSSHVLYGALPAVLDNISIFCILIIIGHHYGNEYVGQYNLSKQFFYGPVSLIAGVVGQVIFRESSPQFSHQKNNQFLFYEMSRYLLGSAALYIFILTLAAPIIVSITFGATWGLAGTMTVILAAGYAARLVVSPLSYFLLTHHAMVVNGIWQVLYFVCINMLFFFQPANPMVFFGAMAGMDVFLFFIYFILIWAVITTGGRGEKKSLLGVKA